MQNNTYIQEDEIDLKELFLIIWKKKLFIFIFVTICTVIAIFYALAKPNVYESKAIFIQNETQKENKILPKSLEGFVSTSFGQNSDSLETYIQLSKSYSFMKKFILEYKLYNEFFNEDKYIYPLFNTTNKKQDNFGIIIDKLNSKQENTIFGIFKTISSNLKISKNKKNNLVTFSYKSPNRFLNKNILNYYISYTGKYLKNKELSKLENTILSLKKEISKVRNIELRNRMLELSANVYKKKVFLQTEDFSGLKNIIMPEVSYIKDKVAPKRSLIVIVAFVTSFILSIFIVFLLNFISSAKED